MHGKGILEHSGSVYDGEFRDNQREGSGNMSFGDGRVYSGSFKSGRPGNIYFYL